MASRAACSWAGLSDDLFAPDRPRQPAAGHVFRDFHRRLRGHRTCQPLIFEGLGVPTETLRLAMLFGPPCALRGHRRLLPSRAEPLDYFASGRRVPAFYSGLVLAQTAMGATGLIAITGAFFFIGFDALCLVIGGLAGFVVMAVLLAPFFRKFGAYTVPSYLGRRFDSRNSEAHRRRAVLALPMLLMLAAELSMGAYAASWLHWRVTRPSSSCCLSLRCWSPSRPAVCARWPGPPPRRASPRLIALLVPVVIVAVIVTNLPLPQLSAGPVLRSIGSRRGGSGPAHPLPPALAFDMPGRALVRHCQALFRRLRQRRPRRLRHHDVVDAGRHRQRAMAFAARCLDAGVYEAEEVARLGHAVVRHRHADHGFRRDFHARWRSMDIVTVSRHRALPRVVHIAARLLAPSASQPMSSVPPLSDISMSLATPCCWSLAERRRAASGCRFLAAAGAVAAALATAGTLAVALGNLLG